MDVRTVISARRSIRRYEKKPLPAELLEELLESARQAPSASNAQRWSMVVVTDDEKKQRLVKASGGQKFVGQCSAYLVAVAEPGAPYPAVDVAIALDHLSLVAAEKGLGTCWIGDFEPEEVKEILGVPKDRDIPICMTLGYPAQNPQARKRKPLSGLFHREVWGRLW
ncbi:MAG: nitroreductase family protein [Candidatus Thermoplasmatota archaeon]|nr:nitroreductase family protein [Candidatus Thermoplasmatota archaeon]